jgi:N-acyl-D-aspartate/D-glutamate deacylase
MSVDLVIRNGLVIDGSGLPGYRADIAVTGDRIVAIGRLPGERATRVIDAEGHVVTPGFIDGHTHMDAQVMWDHLGSSSCWHGVTTAVMGNCGFTLAPARVDARELVVRNLERAEDISAEALAEGVQWAWQSTREYFDAVEHVPKGINYAAYVGHSALRTWAMGERAFTEQATEDDLTEMCLQLRDGLDAGAVGLSTSLTDQHMTSDGRPVASLLASYDELSALCEVVGERPHGMFELAQGADFRSVDPERRATYCRWLEHLAWDLGVILTCGVVPNRQQGDTLSLVDHICDGGGRAVLQSHSRGIWNVLSFRTKMPFDNIPAWRKVRQLSLPEQRVALQDDEVRRSLLIAMRDGPYGERTGAEPRPPDFTTMCLMDTPTPPHRRIADVAAERNVSPGELMIELALRTNFDQLFIQPLLEFDDDMIAETLRHPRTVMTFSDSGAHVSQIVDASIQTHLLAHWVRDRQAFTLPEAVRMMTNAGAVAWGFPQRGLVRTGLIADLNIFDPNTVGPTLPRVVSDLPGGATRLVQQADGFLATIVNGVPVVEHGEHTGQSPGRLLRH